MTAYEMRISDWSSDVCSSDLERVDVPDLDAIEGCGGVDGVQDRAHPRGAPSAEGILQRQLSVGVAVVGEAGGLGHVDEEGTDGRGVGTECVRTCEFPGCGADESQQCHNKAHRDTKKTK